MKNVSVVRHKFAKGEMVKTVPGNSRVKIIAVNFSVGYTVQFDDGSVKGMDESELRFTCGPPARRK